MRKTCTCGNLLSDTTVPNNIVYWTYPKNEEHLLLERFSGSYNRLSQTAIWHCPKCHRFYYWAKDWNLYTYKIDESSSFDLKSINWSENENKYYSYNDFDENEMMNQFKNQGTLNFPVVAHFDLETKTIIVKTKGQILVYVIEDIQPLSRE